ncbi:MAG: TlpA family protein disulfide reductase [Thiobacillaceae bacterium]|nr:TlpA family protein disulfide reductase [Thiobacillaceae bacterium]
MQRHRLVKGLALWLALVLPQAIEAHVPAQSIQLTTMQGKTLKLSSYRGQWVLVNLWAPWCPLCYHEVPALNALDARPDVTVIGVAVDYGTDEDSVRQAIERAGMRYAAQVLGGNRTDPNAQSKRIGPTLFYPTTYVFNPDGRQHEVIVGLVSVERIQAMIDAWRAMAPARKPGSPTAGRP